MGQSAPTIQEFGGLNALAHPGAITTGPDGALWFTEVGNIGRITTSGVVKEFSLGTGSQAVSEPFGIAAAPDGAIWFSMGPNLYRITTTGVVTSPYGSVIDRCQGDLRELIFGPDKLPWAINAPSGIAQWGSNFANFSGCVFSGNPPEDCRGTGWQHMGYGVLCWQDYPVDSSLDPRQHTHFYGISDSDRE